MVKTCKNLTNDFSFKIRYVEDIIFPEHRFANATSGSGDRGCGMDRHLREDVKVTANSVLK